MAPSKNSSRVSSKSPSHEAGAGGKPIQEGVKLTIDTKHANSTTVNGLITPITGASAPGWKGPQQDAGVAVSGDPFVKGSITVKGEGKLSGTAASFKPVGSGASPITFLNHDSTADDAQHPVIVSSDNFAQKQDKGKAKATQEPIGTRGENVSPSRPRVFFSTDIGPNVISPGGHYIKIETVTTASFDMALKALYDGYDWQEKIRGTHCPSRELETPYLDVFICFDDLRDAAQSFQQIETVHTVWEPKYISQTEYASAKKNSVTGTQEVSTFHDGQLILVAQFQGLTSEFTTEGLFDKIEKIARGYGDVLGIAEVDGEAGHWQFRVEYYKISVAKNVLEKLTASTPAVIGKWSIIGQALPDYTLQAAPRDSMGSSPDGLLVTPQKAENGVVMHYVSPTARTAWTTDENGNQVPVQPPKQLPKYQTPTAGPSTTPQDTRQFFQGPQTPVVHANGYTTFHPSGYQNLPHPAHGPHNFQPTKEDLSFYAPPQNVNLRRLKDGIEVRTTIMLRNLPNHLDFRGLKMLLDQVCFGQYDFFYLRIDFNHNSNVGYAFVNFTSPEMIVKFVEYYVYRPWFPDMAVRRGQGPRIAEVSYATIQGTDCLVEKFRNSAVMDEFAAFRPKLWFTFDSAPSPTVVGTEAPFPRPNNASKHQRSRDNAAHIGLYASGKRRQNGNTPNGHHRSQFDRGTPAQIRDEVYHNAFASPIANGHGYGFDQGFPYGQMPSPMAVGTPVFAPHFMPADSGFNSGGRMHYANTPGYIDARGNFVPTNNSLVSFDAYNRLWPNGVYIPPTPTRNEEFRGRLARRQGRSTVVPPRTKSQADRQNAENYREEAEKQAREAEIEARNAQVAAANVVGAEAAMNDSPTNANQVGHSGSSVYLSNGVHIPKRIIEGDEEVEESDHAQYHPDNTEEQPRGGRWIREGNGYVWVTFH